MDNLGIFLDDRKPGGKTPADGAVPMGAATSGGMANDALPAVGAPPITSAQQQPPTQPLPPLVISREKRPHAPLMITISSNGKEMGRIPGASPTTTLPEPSALPNDAQAAAQAQPVQPTMQAQAQAAAQPVAQAQAQGVAQTAAQTAAPFAQPSAQAEPQPAAQTPPQTLEQPSKQAPELAPATTKRKKRSRPRSKPSARRMFLIALRDALIPLALVIILLQFFSPTIVREHSMENTLKENELLYIAKPAYWLASPQYGDIVVFHITTEENEVERNLVKRVIGLPGDSISISGGTVIRNGTPLEEPYLKNGTTPGEMGELTVPEDAYFVLGDNREVSNDSRNPSIGFIEKEQVYGKVILRIFPLDKFRAF